MPVTCLQIWRLRTADPFAPFDLVMSDERVIPVRRPDQFTAHPAMQKMTVAVLDGAFEIIDLLLVTSVKTRNERSRKSEAG